MNATGAGLLPCLSQGGSVVILKEFDAERVIDAIQTHGCTYTTGVPATYKLILAAARQRTQVDVSSLEFIAVGSAPMTRALLDELVQTLPGVDVIEGYGLTECGPIITVNPRGRNKLGTIGPALPGFECKVIDSDGNILPQGEAGELVVRSECNALGYYNRPDAQAERFRDGWVHTGDIVACDPTAGSPSGGASMTRCKWEARTSSRPKSRTSSPLIRKCGTSVSFLSPTR
jgi:acyl-CoA synthetase (AMP-forming)/AMP-acid ligase II